MPRRFLTIILLVAAFATPISAQQATPAPTSAPAPAEDPAALYQAGVRAYYAKAYDEARDKFARIVANYPESPFARDAIYKTAESWRVEGDCERGGGWHALYLQRFPLGTNARDAKARLAECTAKVGHTLTAARPEMRLDPIRHLATWADELPFATEDTAKRAAGQLAAAGLNTMVVAATTRPGVGMHALAGQPVVREGAYFRTTHAPQVADVMSSAGLAARSARVRLLATLPVGVAPWWTASKPEWADRAWDAEAKEPRAGSRLDLFNDEAVDALAALAADLAASSVDGVILTDLASRETESLSPAALAAFTAATQLTYEPREFFGALAVRTDGTSEVELTEPYARFAEVKAARAAVVVRRLVEAIKAARPGLPVFIEIDALSLLAPADALARRSQDAALLAATGVDGFVVRAPWRELAAAQGLLAQDRPKALERLNIEAQKLNADGKKWIFALPIVDPATKTFFPAWEIETAMANACTRMPVGFALLPTRLDFPYHERLQNGLAAGREKGK
ncbi:MAG: hypothetical protein IT350_08285 [Deltaproteobacteria bacterium]|nr:hypothetical protein [Deltaproteobacteria bacterium]